ncbi:MAG TPA: hypothetical protein VFU50_19045 [Terriglobales bacterium]|nr:hypothetical protein [Terriglobales bacterium]
MPLKSLTCTCGNTQLEKIPVRLQMPPNGNGSKALQLVALMCRGDGCGRVTFRPDESAQEAPEETPIPPKPALTANQRIAALFERVYTERLVYKAIAERDPACAQLFDALKTNPEIRASITETFAKVDERLAAGEELVIILEGLPSIKT